MTKYATVNSALELADGSSWNISAEDKISSTIAAILSNTMQLKPSGQIGQRRIIVKNGCPPEKKSPFFSVSPGLHPARNNQPVVCRIRKPENNDELAIQLMKMSLIFCSHIESQGGLLIHGALAEKHGIGVILAGPGDVGKTTASGRLPAPWISLSDDCTLIVRDGKGGYRTHPWPTWSTFMYGGPGGSWDVQYSVPLKAIFVLKQNLTRLINSPFG